MKEKRILFGTVITVIAVIFLSFQAAGCKSVPKEISKTRIELIRNADSTKSFRFTGAFPPKTFFTGYVTNETGDEMTLVIESFHWFNNWNDGWTEAVFSATGDIKLSRKTGTWQITIGTMPVLEYPERATIRYRDTIIEGDSGLKQFKNRWDRITATSEFLATGLKDEIKNWPDFSVKGGKFLFPEVYGYGIGYKESSAVKENRNLAEGTSWDLRYTEEILPEEFREVRNSGTLFRDWQESSELFYISFNWKNILESGIQNISGNITENITENISIIEVKK